MECVLIIITTIIDNILLHIYKNEYLLTHKQTETSRGKLSLHTPTHQLTRPLAHSKLIGSRPSLTSPHTQSHRHDSSVLLIIRNKDWPC